jgi:DNA-binding response OmpR family regulator
MIEPVKRVLLVEDDVHLTEVLRVHLQDDGYALEHVGDGRLAMALVERGGWDAIILDLMLPGVDGLEICSRATHQSSSPVPAAARCIASSGWKWAPMITWPSPSRSWSSWHA